MDDISNKTFEEISTYVDSLLAINGDNLDTASIENPKIFTQLHRMYVQAGRKLEKMLNQKDKVEHLRTRHYNGKMPAEHYKKDPLNEAVLKTDIPMMLNIDPIVVEVRSIVKEQERIVEYLEEAKKQLKSRSYDIKTAVEWRKIMMGM